MKWKRKQRNHYHNSERRKYEISIFCKHCGTFLFGIENNRIYYVAKCKKCGKVNYGNTVSVSAKEKDEWGNKKCSVISQKGGSVITSNHNYFGVFLYVNYTISQYI